MAGVYLSWSQKIRREPKKIGRSCNDLDHIHTGTLQGDLQCHGVAWCCLHHFSWGKVESGCSLPMGGKEFGNWENQLMVDMFTLCESTAGHLSLDIQKTAGLVGGLW